MTRSILVFIAGAVLFGAVSCTKTAEPPAGKKAPRVFQVKGVVKALRPSQKQVEIQHEEVPDFMPAMTMPFDVKDTNELTGIEPGQPVSFRLTVTDTEAWIDQVRKLGAASTNADGVRPTTRLARDVEPLNPGDLLPEYQFTNQLGQAFGTQGFKGQALAFTFIFTRCPYPTFCPRMSSEFQAVQQGLLTTRPALTNWHLLTISFDPEFDTPEVLRDYAQARGYNPRHWTFATGALIDITAIGEQFGLAFWRDINGAINHNLRTVVVDAAGRVQKVFDGNNWTSGELIEEMVIAAGKR